MNKNNVLFFVKTTSLSLLLCASNASANEETRCLEKVDGTTVCIESKFPVPADIGLVQFVSTPLPVCKGNRDGDIRCWVYNSHACAVKADNSVICWGANRFSECEVPQGLGVVKAITVSDHYTCVIKADGEKLCWGDKRSFPVDFYGW